MSENKNKFVLITKMWAPLAFEYAKFLNRYGLETITIVAGETRLGGKLAVYANEEKYLELTQTNNHFNQEEKQIVELLEAIYLFARIISEELACENEFEEDDDYEDSEYDYIEYDDDE